MHKIFRISNDAIRMTFQVFQFWYWIYRGNEKMFPVAFYLYGLTTFQHLVQKSVDIISKLSRCNFPNHILSPDPTRSCIVKCYI